MSRPQINIEAIDAATAAVIADGHRVLQTHMYADTEEEQVRFLLDCLNPQEGAVILDAGCGVGMVSELMYGLRPDLRFVLANISEYQLLQCPSGEQYEQVLCDLHATPLDSASVDAAMYSSTLCQLDIPVALREARRVIRAGGTLLINDMVRDTEDAKGLEPLVAARVLYANDLCREVMDAGFDILSVGTPDYNDSYFRGLLGEHGNLLDGVRPIILVARAGGQV